MARDLTDEEKQHWLEATGRAKPPKQPEKIVAPAAAASKPVKTKVIHALAPLEPRQAEKRFKPHARVQATIDLHGMTQEEAFATLGHFLQKQIHAGKRHVAIITGKGRASEGVLRRAVPQWLELPQFRPFVAAITHAHPKKGGEGVLHVLLKQHAR